MRLPENHIGKIVSDLQVIAYKSGMLVDKGLIYSEYEEFFRVYCMFKENVKQIEFSDEAIDARVKHFPAIISPHSLFIADLQAGYLSFVIVNLYVTSILVIVTAPVSIPFFIMRAIARKKLKEKLREIARLSSSVAFIIEHPDFFKN